MTFRTFFFGLFASFGLAWLMVVVVPFFKMRDLQPIEFKEGLDTQEGIYFPKRSGRVLNGAEVYAQNGCYLCHTQVIRPTYAGNDFYREGWAGQKDNGDGVDTRRETNAFDFQMENYAQIGVTRFGPDLSNLGRRVETIYAKDMTPEQWLYLHFYEPRREVTRRESVCPPLRFMFEARKVHGAPSDKALPFTTEDGEELVPTAEARALVSYLLSLKKDDTIPASLNFAPPKAKPETAAK